MMNIFPPASKGLFFLSLTLCTVFSVSCQANTFTQDTEKLYFLSATEAEELHLNDTEWASTPIRTRGLSAGPIINFKNPVVTNLSNPTLETHSPLNLTVFFQENSAAVDMSTLTVIAKKGFFSKSLTDRILPFIQGTTLNATGLTIPSGKFRIQITIADIHGNQTQNDYRLVVGAQ